MKKDRGALTIAIINGLKKKSKGIYKEETKKEEKLALSEELISAVKDQDPEVFMEALYQFIRLCEEKE